MNRYHTLLAACCMLLSTTAFAQMKFNLKLIPDSDHWGVFVKPYNDLTPSTNTITGSGQVTVVLPIGNDIANLTQNAGHWVENATVSGPDEAPNKNFISFGFLNDNPQIVYQKEEETLLFTFQVVGDAEGSPRLIDNREDQFAIFPNSIKTNPGNEISIVDLGASPVGYYQYDGNYTDEKVPTTTPIAELPAIAVADHSNDKFTISPNPTSEWLNVDFSNFSDFEKMGSVRLWTASGVTIGEMDRDEQDDLSINVGALPNGIYFISYEMDGEVLQRERFVKH